ncbi:conserved Plasmodium protein, unknown function [Plasmodium gallinaceum]|uniref:Uncharacterized protein n=1 Tax=Plasmodium gallinaceum TaxID=5849 RepID=A0A1J1H0I8_PLAGA|nr:conserved Plasmodium protein, unknown function [Plasmodium gallinaceum]CRG97042.1 conserved Plasmodium protein, unknown function [Plasmodium gallinaceum]
MDKKLKKGILLIRKYAEKYKNVIFKTLKLKSRKTINKKKKKKEKKILKIIEKNNNNTEYKEEKKRKLDNYLINQEKELDFQENYSFFNKFHDRTDNIFYKNENDNVPDSLKLKKTKHNNEEQTFNSINDNFLDSLNSLHFKIKQEIEANNDLLSLKEFSERNNITKVESNTQNDINKQKISQTDEDLKASFKKEENFTEKQLVYPSKKKIKKKKNDSKYMLSSKCEKKINHSSDIELNENYQSIYLGKEKLNLLENKDEEKKNEKIVSSFNMNPKKIIDDTIQKNNEILTEKKKNDLVFGKNKFENINELFQKVFEGNEYNQNNSNEIVKYNNQEKDEDNINVNEYGEKNMTIYHNILNKKEGTYVNEYFKGDINCQDTKIISEENVNCNDNKNNLNHVEKDEYRDNIGDINTPCNQNNLEEIKKYNNVLTPFKEDNSFDFFFNESLGTPSIFQM